MKKIPLSPSLFALLAVAFLAFAVPAVRSLAQSQTDTKVRQIGRASCRERV